MHFTLMKTAKNKVQNMLLKKYYNNFNPYIISHNSTSWGELLILTYYLKFFYGIENSEEEK